MIEEIKQLFFSVEKMSNTRQLTKYIEYKNKANFKNNKYMQYKYIYNKNLFLQNIFLALIVYYGSISESVFYDFEGMHRGRTVVGFKTTCTISAYHH